MIRPRKATSLGKTRSAFEAVKALLPDWWLVHPAGPAEVTALAAVPPPRMVVCSPRRWMRNDLASAHR
jgi:hypothetical protein